MTAKFGCGVNGFLSPEGKLYACNYMEHGKLAAKIIEEIEEKSNLYPELVLRKDLSWIALSSGNEGSSISIVDGEYTPEQLRWFRNNYDALCHKQQFSLNVYGEMCGWEVDKEMCLADKLKPGDDVFICDGWGELKPDTVLSISGKRKDIRTTRSKTVFDSTGRGKGFSTWTMPDYVYPASESIIEKYKVQLENKAYRRVVHSCSIIDGRTFTQHPKAAEWLKLTQEILSDLGGQKNE